MTRAEEAGLKRDAARWLIAGALLMLLAVVLGAFGAHALKNMLPAPRLATYQTGVTYHSLHAVGLIAVGLLAQVTRASPWIGRAGTLMCAGIVLFSGSLYALAGGAPRLIGVITPLGGMAFMLAWLCVALHVREVRSNA